MNCKKEAEKSFKQKYPEMVAINSYYIEGFECGAEFGYNKAKEESKKYRKFTSFFELTTEFIKRFEVKTQSYALPLIWVKRKDKYEMHLITGYVLSEQDGQLVKIGNVYYSLGELFEHYEFLDDSPCGVYE